jgi:uncharacterized protein
MLPDINVLVAAYRADHPQHAAAVLWLKSTLAESIGVGRLVLPMQVMAGFMRLVTNVRIFPDASTSAHALQFLDWLADDPRVSVLTQSSEWFEFRKLVHDRQLRANQIPDAWLAGLSISLSEPFVTFDKGFRQLLPRSLLVLLSPAPAEA